MKRLFIVLLFVSSYCLGSFSDTAIRHGLFHQMCYKNKDFSTEDKSILSNLLSCSKSDLIEVKVSEADLRQHKSLCAEILQTAILSVTVGEIVANAVGVDAECFTQHLKNNKALKALLSESKLYSK